MQPTDASAAGETPADLVHGGEADRWGGWTWREPHRGEHFRRCSYCGSMHPDDFAEEIARGPLQVDWADRKYGWPHKVYVHVPNREPDALFCVSRANWAQPAPYIAAEDLTDEQREIVLRDGWGAPDAGSWYHFTTRANHFGKFYTKHLADPTLSDETQERIAQRIGLRFEFFDGKVRWLPVEVATDE